MPSESDVTYRDTRNLPRDQVLELYEANSWSSADKPDQLMAALRCSHSLVSAWCNHRLVGLANAISDGHLVVYYPHILVHPDYQRRGIGRQLIVRLSQPYQGFHQQVLVADSKSPSFYKKLGFMRAGDTVPMWIYGGHDH